MGPEVIAALKAFFGVLLGKAFVALDAWLRRQERDALIVDKAQAEAEAGAARADLETLGRMADAPDITDADDARRRMRERPPGTR
jgi:hypothetical protein